MAAPSPNPYLAVATRLDQQFAFTSRTPILDTLNKLIVAIEARLQPLDDKIVDIDEIIDSITAIALGRLDETFTPLIEEAQSRLEEFGAAFSATSTTSLAIATGPGALIIPTGEREAFIFGDYCVIRHTGGNETMRAQVTGYDRDIGQLTFNTELITGSGTFNDWTITFALAPDLTHETDYNNPHQTTAAQTGAYTTAEVNALLNDQAAVYSALITDLDQQIIALDQRVTALETE